MAAELITADTSVVVPALTAWHAAHGSALAALDGIKCVPGHVIVESFSVLTRLPKGRAIRAADAAERLTEEFPEPPLVLSADEYRDLLRVLSRGHIVGGAVYDAVVGLSARRAGAVLRSRDVRAWRTYEMLGVEFEIVD